ncbi:hypothetical protein WA158_005516 [Blastocystis sp. Blastoise]
MEIVDSQVQVPEVTLPKPKLHFEIFYNIKLLQQQNGLKQSDFSRYRQFCARKIRRVRKRIDFTYGKKVYTPRLFTVENVKDSGSLFVPLLETERAWAYAMEIKQDLANQDTSRSHFHLLSRLKKTCHNAELLLSICNEMCDDDTMLEAEAYSNYIHGVYYVEIDKYSEALDCFLKCQNILSHLHEICISILLKVYSDKLKELEPYIRYCKYNMKSNNDEEELLNINSKADHFDSVLQSKIQDILMKKHNQNKGDLSIIQWRSIKIPVENDQIRICLLKARDLETELCEMDKEDKEKVLDAYSDIFSTYDEAHRIISQDIDKLSKSVGSSTISNRNIQIFNYIFAYIKYLKLCRVLERNIFLFSIYYSTYTNDQLAFNKKKITIPDILTIIASILHNIEDTQQVLSQKTPEEIDIDEDTTQQGKQSEEYIMQQHLLAFNYIFRTWRAYFAATIRCIDANTYPLLMNILTPFKYQVLSNSVINKLPISEVDTTIKYNSETNIMDKLDEVMDINGDVKLFEIPPKMTALTCKPLFFDILAEEMNYDSIHFEKYLQKNQQKKTVAENKPISMNSQKKSIVTPSTTQETASNENATEQTKGGWFSSWW